MQFTEVHKIKKTNENWIYFDNLCSLTKNLYNASLYDVRQHYFDTKKFKTWQTQRKEFVKNNNPDYRKLNSHIAGEVLMQVGRSYRAFFNSLKSKKVKNKKIRIPSYLAKTGRNVCTIPKLAISKKVTEIKPNLFQHRILPTTLNLKITSKQENIDMIKIVPKSNEYELHVIYTKNEKELKKNNNRIASIDLGVNNICAISYNTGQQPELINGRHIKSINQFYNKNKAKFQSKLNGKRKTSKKIKNLTRKRENKLNFEFHKISNYIMNQLVSTNIDTLIIGKNKGWKQDINIGKRNNQNFVNIPYSKLIHQLEYKCKLNGIHFILTEENYTSKCSFLDNEEIKKHEVYLGKRITRGLFKSKDGKLINADINGSFNIMKKAAPNAISYGVEGVAIHPILIKI